MALTAILCSTDPGAVKDQKQRDLEYLRMSNSPGHSSSDSNNSKRTKSNPFRRKPRGYKSDGVLVQVDGRQNRSQKKKSSGGAGNNQSYSQQGQQRIGTIASGLKENGARFLKNHSFQSVRRNLIVKARKTVSVEKSKEKANEVPPLEQSQPLPSDTPIKELPLDNELASQTPGLNCSISFDSGHGDDLSSSCDSSVILENGGVVQKCPSNLQLLQMEPIVSEEEMSPEDDIFMDALSNLSSDDEEFVTPLTSRSTSMTHLASATDDEDESQSILTTTTSTNSLTQLQLLQESLSEIIDSEQLAEPDVNMTLSNLSTAGLQEEGMFQDLNSSLGGCCEDEKDTETQTDVSLGVGPSEDLTNSGITFTVEDQTVTDNTPGLLLPQVPADSLLISEFVSSSTSLHKSACPDSEGHDSFPLSPSCPPNSLSPQPNKVLSSSPKIQEHSPHTRSNPELSRLRTSSSDSDISSASQSHTPFSDSNNLPVLSETTDDSCDSSNVTVTGYTTNMHPLYYKWVLWYDKLTTGRPQLSDYAAQLQKVSSISSVEEFWSVFNNLLPPSQLAKNANYHFFKEGIQPLWEDAANKHGGKWVITFKNNSPFLDKAWLEVLMALVGENIDKSHLITGVVLSRRKKGDRIALWTKEKKNKLANLHICKQLLSVLRLACNVTKSSYSQFVCDLAEDRCGFNMVYMHHMDSMRSGTSYQNEARLTLKQHLQFMLTGSCR